MFASSVFWRCRACGAVTRLLCNEPSVECYKHVLLCFSLFSHRKTWKGKEKTGNTRKEIVTWNFFRRFPSEEKKGTKILYRIKKLPIFKKNRCRCKIKHDTI